MRVIIAGSRGIRDLRLVVEAIHNSGFETDITEVVSGTAHGVDRLGEVWAGERNLPIRRFPADWENYGRVAGHIRNEEMARCADALVAVWDGESKGTKNMIEVARIAGLKVYVETP